jgi:antirestriction protein ArdC
MATLELSQPLTGLGAGSEPGHDQPQQALRERVEAVQAQLLERVAAIRTSDQWLEWIRFARTMSRRNHSLANQLLIWTQDPQATWCLGFRAWQTQQRWVRKGERGIRIWAPLTKTAKTNSDPSPQDSDTTRTIYGFRLVTVFDVRQTDGHNPIPEQPSPTLLTGDAPTMLWDRLANLIAEQGFSLERGECGAANGWTNYTTQTVRVRNDVEDAQAVKTLAHELGHVLLHEPSMIAGTNCRGHREVEAETFAALVCELAGLPTSSYSAPYVASWSTELITENEDVIAVLLKHTKRVLDVIEHVIGPLLTPPT